VKKDEDWVFDEIRFDSLEDVIQAIGNVVVTGCIRCVATRTKPDGSPQKQNAPSTVKRKGHDHPVVEYKHRFEKRSTYLVLTPTPRSGMVTLRRDEDSRIGAELEKKSYDFFGITDDAYRQGDALMDEYLKDQVRKAWQGKA
jgi:hypothetical protein